MAREMTSAKQLRPEAERGAAQGCGRNCLPPLRSSHCADQCTPRCPEDYTPNDIQKVICSFGGALRAGNRHRYKRYHHCPNQSSLERASPAPLAHGYLQLFQSAERDGEEPITYPGYEQSVRPDVANLPGKTVCTQNAGCGYANTGAVTRTHGTNLCSELREGTQQKKSHCGDDAAHDTRWWNMDD